MTPTSSAASPAAPVNFLAAAAAYPHPDALPGADRRQMLQALEAELHASSAQPDHFVDLVPGGFLAAQLLAWDTSHFGFPIARLNHLYSWIEDGSARHAAIAAMHQNFVRFCRQRGVRMVSAGIQLDDTASVQSLLQLGWGFMDVQITYAFDYRRQQPNPFTPGVKLRGYQEGDLEALVPMARTAYRLGRFYADGGFDHARVDELYAEWVKNSCLGKIAEHTVVAEDGGRTVGFTTCRTVPHLERVVGFRVAQLVLSAVDPNARGKGVYGDMIAAGVEWGRSRADVLFLGTQANNFPVQRAWCGLGFKPVRTTVGLHWWLK